MSEFTPADASEESALYLKKHHRAVEAEADLRGLANIGRTEAARADNPEDAEYHKKRADMYERKADREVIHPSERGVIDVAKYAVSQHPDEYFDAAVEQANREGVHIDTGTPHQPEAALEADRSKAKN